MLYYSTSALRYAVDRCLEILGYKVLISTSHRKEADDYLKKYIKSIDIGESPPYMFRCSSSPVSTYDFFNTSRITVALPHENLKARRCNLLIADMDLNKSFIQYVLRPIELPKRFEAIQCKHSKIEGLEDDKTRI